MKTYVAPCGIGLGHATRCEPLARRLMAWDTDVVFSTYLDGLDYVMEKKFKVVDTVPVGFKVKTDGTIDFKQTAASRPGIFQGLYQVLKQLNRELSNIGSYRPDVVLSDSRATPLMAASMLSIPSILLLNQYRVDIVRKPSTESITRLDQLFYLYANLIWTFTRTLIGGVWSLSEYILIPDLPYPYTISLGNLSIPERTKPKVKLIGPLIPHKPEELPSQTELKGKLGFDISKPLIHAAISGPRIERTYLTERLTRILSTLPNYYQVVMSRGNIAGPNKVEKYRNLVVYDWIDNQFEILKACDVIVSRAGHGTVMKALTYGKPLVLIPIPEHTEQFGNAKRAAQLKVAKVIMQNELNEKTLLNAIDEIFQSESYTQEASKISEIACKLDAVETAAKLTLEVANKF